MKVWTVHERAGSSPVLLRDGFSFAALLFGPFWLALHRAWLPAAATMLLIVLTLVLSHPPAAVVVMAGIAVLLGCSGWDLVRWSLAHRGYLESDVVVGRNRDDASLRLFGARPDLVERAMVAETAP